MNLFIDAHVFDDTPQGTTTYLSGLYNELIKNNPGVNFFFGGYNIGNLRFVFGGANNVRYIKYGTRNKYLRLFFEVPYIILRYKIDISHFQYILPAFRFSREILTLHDILFLDYPELYPRGFRIVNKILFRHSARRADFLLTVSDFSKGRISEHFKIVPEQLHVIPNGVSASFFRPPDFDADIKQKYNLDKYILYVSRIEPRKNHLLLAKVFAELNLWKDGYKLVFIGSRTIPVPSLDEYMTSLPDNIKSSILFKESSVGDELKTFYRNCSLFVYPSLAEGFGIPPLEAAASEVPVLCSRTTAMADYLFLGDNLFNPSDPEELKSKIMKALSLHDKMDAKKNSEYVKLHYSWQKSASMFSELIFNTI
jgi:glycosyltransferase involved in cell wall biosynthesis